MKLYCGTYGKYNDGSLFGEWIDLDDFSNLDDFLVYCRELHDDEEDPEFMFQDCECEYEWEEKLYSECFNSSEYWEIKEELERLCVSSEMFDAWINATGNAPTADEVRNAKDNFIYRGSLADYLEEISEECGDIPERLKFYIDWNKMADDESGYYNIYDDYIFAA